VFFVERITTCVSGGCRRFRIGVNACGLSQTARRHAADGRAIHDGIANWQDAALRHRSKQEVSRRRQAASSRHG